MSTDNLNDLTADLFGETPGEPGAVRHLSPTFSKAWGSSDTPPRGVEDDSRATQSVGGANGGSEELTPDDWVNRVKPDTMVAAAFGYVKPESVIRDARSRRDLMGIFGKQKITVDMPADRQNIEFNILKSGSRFHELILQAPQVKIYACPRTEQNATVRVRLGAQFWLTHQLGEHTDYLADLLAALGCTAERVHVSQLDLCCDITEQIPEGAFYCRRGNGNSGRASWEAIPGWTHAKSSKWTGFRNSSRKGIKVRVYDKHEEVSEKDLSHYKAAFQRYGLDAMPELWRVEFSIPREKLRDGFTYVVDEDGELRTKDVSVEEVQQITPETVAGLWRYLTQSYLWLSKETVQEQGRADRSTVDPIWHTVASAAARGKVWKPSKNDDCQETPCRLFRSGAGSLATGLARAGVGDCQEDIDNALRQVVSFAETTARDRFIDALCKYLREKMQLRGAPEPLRDEWGEELREVLGDAMEGRAVASYLYHPFLETDDAEDGAGHEAAEDRL